MCWWYLFEDVLRNGTRVSGTRSSVGGSSPWPLVGPVQSRLTVVESEIDGILVLNPLPTADSLGRPEREESTGQASMVTNRKGGSNFLSHKKSTYVF